MCGIAGAVSVTTDARPDPEVVRRMSASMAHRGPDGEGTWVSGNGRVCFAHRRLSIIDLESGQQPFAAEDDSACLVFNGELYNYLELRSELIQEGVRFRTESDTEVLFHILRRRGPSGLDKVIGMFAFAFWSEETGNLVLARDRVGKKPLFYALRDGCLYFSSTLRGIEAAFGSMPEVSPGAVANFLDVGYVPAPDTIYRDVWKVSAATWVQVSGDPPELTARRYWRPGTGEQLEYTETQALDALEALLDSAVQLRLRSDVPWGVFLSSGVDSSLVAALASRASDRAVRTFTIGFDAAEYDESSRARAIADHLGAEHHEFRLEADLLDLLPTAIRHFGEPFADSSALPLWLLAQNARETVTVALMGDGGDEGFGGYDWYRTALSLDRGGGMFGGALGDLAQTVARPLGRRVRRGAALLSRDAAGRFADLRCMFGPLTQGGVVEPGARYASSTGLGIRERIEALYREGDQRPAIRMQYADLRTYLADDLLPKVDVATMAHGLEARAPLLDHRILDFAFDLPASLNDPRDPKRLLRKVLDRHIPSELFAGPKRGFTVPLRDWFRGPLRPQLMALSDGAVVAPGIVRPDGVRSIVREHLGGVRDHTHRLFHLLVLDQWLSH